MLPRQLPPKPAEVVYGVRQEADHEDEARPVQILDDSTVGEPHNDDFTQATEDSPLATDDSRLRSSHDVGILISSLLVVVSLLILIYLYTRAR